MTETSVSHFCGSRDTKKGGVFPWMFLFYKPHLRIESQESRASGHFFLFCFNFPAQPLDDRASSHNLSPPHAAAAADTSLSRECVDWCISIFSKRKRFLKRST